MREPAIAEGLPERIVPLRHRQFAVRHGQVEAGAVAAGEEGREIGRRQDEPGRVDDHRVELVILDHDHILTRLTSTGADQHPWSLLILAALDGPQALADYLGGSRAITPPAKPRGKAKTKPADTSAIEPPGVYLGAITVSGFRGIGPATTLPLHPGPGLTLVVGRNGSGKSSFAEGAEVLLTGTSLRWEGRTKAWKLGWRNLHQAETASVSAELLVEGDGPLVASRTWSADADLGAGVVTAKAKGGKAQPLDTLGWAGALATFRPFLSYNELGSLLEDGPSALYDALSTVLGLEEFVVVQTRLADARKERQARVTACKAAATTLAVQAEQVERAHPKEARAVHLAALLKAKTWDLPALRALAEGGADATRDVLDGLKRLAALTPPNVQAVQDAVTRLRQSAAQLAATHGTDAARSLARAQLLAQALAFHAAHDAREHDLSRVRLGQRPGRELEDAQSAGGGGAERRGLRRPRRASGG